MFRSALSLAVCLFGAGCAKGTPPPFKPTIALLADSAGFAPGTFGGRAQAGLAACAALTGAKIATDTTAGTDYDRHFMMLATENYDTVIGVGGEMAADLAGVARHYEGTHFAIIDGVVNAPNVTSITFKDQDGAFLAGALAALVSRTKHVALLGGADIPRLQAARAGFEAGVREIDPRIRVSTAYVGSFVDEAAGAARAKAVFASGADIAYVVAGRAGLGAIATARETRGAYVIGADSDQDALAPGKVLTSVLRRYDTAASVVCQEASGQKPATGIETLGLAEEGVGLTRFRYSKAMVGAANLARIERIRAAIVAGTIVPPATVEAAARFEPVRV